MQPIKKNGFQSSYYILDISEFINGPVGDFNFHWDYPTDTKNKHTSNLTESSNPTQWTQEYPHRSICNWDLVIYQEDDIFVK